MNIRAELAAVIAKLGRPSVTFLRTANEQTDLLLAREPVSHVLADGERTDRLAAGARAAAGNAVVVLWRVRGVVVTLGLCAMLLSSVAQRRREIGVRVVSLVVGEGVVITGVGIVAGLPLAVWARSTSGALLFQAPTVDSVAILITIATVALASTIASAVPARTAAKLAPSEALRHL